MVFIMWVLSFLVPIFEGAGIFVFAFMLVPEAGFMTIDEIEIWQWILSVILGICGFIIGFKHWDLYQAPREFWRNSKVDLLHTRLGISFNMFFAFFAIIPDICFILSLVG